MGSIPGQGHVLGLQVQSPAPVRAHSSSNRATCLTLMFLPCPSPSPTPVHSLKIIGKIPLSKDNKEPKRCIQPMKFSFYPSLSTQALSEETSALISHTSLRYAKQTNRHHAHIYAKKPLCPLNVILLFFTRCEVLKILHSRCTDLSSSISQLWIIYHHMQVS